MSWIPWDSLLLLVVLDLVIVVMTSVAMGVLVARAAGDRAWKGVAIGVLVPVVGPLVHGLVAVGRAPGRWRADRSDGVSRPAVAAGALLVVATACLLVAAPLTWGTVSGSVDRYSWGMDASATDNPVTLVAVVLSALTLAVSALLVLFSEARIRLAVVALMIGGTWILVTVDGLVLFSALAGVTDAASDASGGVGSAEIGAAAGLWVTLSGGVLAMIGAGAIAFGSRDRRASVDGAGATASSGQPADAPPVTALDYGDGF